METNEAYILYECSLMAMSSFGGARISCASLCPVIAYTQTDRRTDRSPYRSARYHGRIAAAPSFILAAISRPFSHVRFTPGAPPPKSPVFTPDFAATTTCSLERISVKKALNLELIQLRSICAPTQPERCTISEYCCLRPPPWGKRDTILH